jgi:hypothetical protein
MKSLLKKIQKAQSNIEYIKKEHMRIVIEQCGRVAALKKKYVREAVDNVLKSLNLKDGDKVTNGIVIGKIAAGRSYVSLKDKVNIVVIVGDDVVPNIMQVYDVLEKYFVRPNQVVTSSKDTRWRKCWMDRMDLKKEEVMKEEILY